MFIIINNVGTQISVDVNVKNYLTKEYVIKDLFGILVIVIIENENCKCRKKLVDKLVEECSENIYENEMTYNVYGEVCNSCTI